MIGILFVIHSSFVEIDIEQDPQFLVLSLEPVFCSD
jgi:hypothetical protein